MEGESSPQCGDGRRDMAMEEDLFRAQLQLNGDELPATAVGRNPWRGPNPS
jgi:hypothetical protein